MTRLAYSGKRVKIQGVPRESFVFVDYINGHSQDQEHDQLINVEKLCSWSGVYVFVSIEYTLRRSA